MRNALGQEGLTGPDHRPIGQNDSTQLQSPTAMWTCDRLPWLRLVRLDLRKMKATAELDQPSDGIKVHFAVGVHEAKVSDFHEAGGKHMLEESPDKFHDMEGHGSPPVAVRVFVAKGHDSILHFDNATVGDSHFEDIGSQVLYAGRTLCYCLAVDVPLRLPSLGRDLLEKTCRLHLVSELGSEDF
jgi:hypothetical protein